MQTKLFNRHFILVWFGSLCLLLIHNILNNGIPLYLDSIGFSTSFSGLLGVPFALLGIMGRMLGGYLVDRRGRRIVMVGGTLLMGVAAFLLGLLPVAAAMLLFRALTGVGFSSAQAAYSTASVDVTPPKHTSLGVGIFWAAMALSVACAGYITLGLSAGGNYRPVFVTCLILGVLGALLSLLCNYEKGRPVPKTPETPEKSRGIHSLLEKSAWKPAVVEFLVMLGVASCNSFILMFAKAQNYANQGSFLLIAAVAMAAGNLSAPALMNRLGAKNLLGAGMVVCGILYALMALVPCQATFYLGGVGYGLSLGFSYPVLTVLTVQGAPEQRRGTATSTMLMAGDIGVGLGTFFWGAVIEAFSYSAAFTLSGVSVLLAGVLTFLFYLRQTR